MPTKRDTAAEWLPLDVAAERYGYAFKESFTRRLRQLRERGHVVDIGRPPMQYRQDAYKQEHAVVLMWPNAKVALLRSDAPAALLAARRGRPNKSA